MEPTGTPVALHILLCNFIEFQSAECDGLFPYPDQSQVGADFRIEPVAVHSQVPRRIPMADEARQDRDRCLAH